MASIVYIVTVGISARNLLRGQLRYMREQGHDVALICSPGPDLVEAGRREGVSVYPVSMSREIDPVADLKALTELIRILRRLRPDVVNASTPKAGLLGMLSARATGVPARIQIMRGLRLETASGLKHTILGVTERLTSACAHRVIAVSPSLRERYLQLGLGRSDKCTVLAHGSSNGVDPARFDLGSDSMRGQLAVLRKELHLDGRKRVIGFVGRLTRDKGLKELGEAYHRVRTELPGTQLLVVGDFEEGDPVAEDLRATLRKDPNVHITGFVLDAAPYYGLMDVLAFPSYREGFPNVPLEAASAGIPSVGFATTGTVDAIADGKTGSLVPLGDSEALAHELLQYLRNKSLRDAHGRAARRRAEIEFRPELIWEALATEYERVLEHGGTTATRQKGMALLAKRAVDVTAAAGALALTSPLMLGTAVAVRISMGAPVFFRQPRVGRDARIFTVMKFRTMSDARAPDGQLLPDAERLTQVGRFIRSSSLDELPQLLNVLKGDMSLVGPRPLLVQYLERYSEDQSRRHDVLPGITGWAAINGRNTTSWRERFALDVWYVDHWSLWLDLKILFKTLPAVLGREGVSAEGHVTMAEFMGDESASSEAG